MSVKGGNSKTQKRNKPIRCESNTSMKKMKTMPLVKTNNLPFAQGDSKCNWYLLSPFGVSMIFFFKKKIRCLSDSSWLPKKVILFDGRDQVPLVRTVMHH